MDINSENNNNQSDPNKKDSDDNKSIGEIIKEEVASAAATEATLAAATAATGGVDLPVTATLGAGRALYGVGRAAARILPKAMPAIKNLAKEAVSGAKSLFNSSKKYTAAKEPAKNGLREIKEKAIETAVPEKAIGETVAEKTGGFFGNKYNKIKDALSKGKELVKNNRGKLGAAGAAVKELFGNDEEEDQEDYEDQESQKVTPMKSYQDISDKLVTEPTAALEGEYIPRGSNLPAETDQTTALSSSKDVVEILQNIYTTLIANQSSLKTISNYLNTLVDFSKKQESLLLAQNARAEALEQEKKSDGGGGGGAQRQTSDYEEIANKKAKPFSGKQLGLMAAATGMLAWGKSGGESDSSSFATGGAGGGAAGADAERITGEIMPGIKAAKGDGKEEYTPFTLDKEVGSISKKYESNNGGPGTVSTGKGDKGGASYGTYQLSSKTGTLNEFLKSSKYGKEFEGLSPGSSEFNSKWKQVAKDDPGFGDSQHAFIQKTHFDPQVNKLKKSGINLSGKGRAVQEAIWSTTTQFGGNTGVIQNALKGKDAENMSDKEIVSAIQDYKIEHNASLFKSSPSLHKSLLNRAKSEKEDLIKITEMPDAKETTGHPIEGPRTYAEPTLHEMAQEQKYPTGIEQIQKTSPKISDQQELFGENKPINLKSNTLVAGVPVIEGQPLTKEQVAMTDMATKMGNKPSQEIQAAYDSTKGKQSTPESKETSNKVQSEDIVAENQINKSEQDKAIQTSTFMPVEQPTTENAEITSVKSGLTSEHVAPSIEGVVGQIFSENQDQTAEAINPNIEGIAGKVLPAIAGIAGQMIGGKQAYASEGMIPNITGIAGKVLGGNQGQTAEGMIPNITGIAGKVLGQDQTAEAINPNIEGIAGKVLPAITGIAGKVLGQDQTAEAINPNIEGIAGKVLPAITGIAGKVLGGNQRQTAEGMIPNITGIAGKVLPAITGIAGQMIGGKQAYASEAINPNIEGIAGKVLGGNQGQTAEAINPNIEGIAGKVLGGNQGQTAEAINPNIEGIAGKVLGGNQGQTAEGMIPSAIPIIPESEINKPQLVSEKGEPNQTMEFKTREYLQKETQKLVTDNQVIGEEPLAKKISNDQSTSEYIPNNNEKLSIDNLTNNESVIPKQSDKLESVSNNIQNLQHTMKTNIQQPQQAPQQQAPQQQNNKGAPSMKVPPVRNDEPVLLQIQFGNVHAI